MRSAIALLVLATSATAFGQEAAQPASFTPAQAPSREVMEAFKQRFLSVDLDSGQASRGTAHVPVGLEEFLAEVGRPDLVAQVQSTRHLKTGLYVVGASLALAGATAGTIELANKPNPDAPPCSNDVHTFNACQTSGRRDEQLAAAFFVTGPVLGAVIALVGYKLDPSPVSPFEARQLANAHNEALWRELRGQTLSVAPVLAPNGGGLALKGSF